MKRRFLIACLALVASCQPALAEQCAPREVILEALADRYGEGIVARGLHAQGGMIELFVNPDTGTWTIIGTVPGGPSCLLGAGEAWEAVTAPAEGDPA